MCAATRIASSTKKENIDSASNPPHGLIIRGPEVPGMDSISAGIKRDYSFFGFLFARIECLFLLVVICFAPV